MVVEEGVGWGGGEAGSVNAAAYVLSPGVEDSIITVYC